MTEPQADSIRKQESRDKSLAYVVYALFAVGFLSGFLITVVGLIIAYLARAKTSDSVLHSHYSYQIHLFWWSFLVIVGAIVFVLIALLAVEGILLIGAVISLLVVLIWLVVLIVLLCRGIFRLMDDTEAPSLLPNRS